MTSQTGFVVVIDLDPRRAFEQFVGLDPLELVQYLKELQGIAVSEIEKCQPDIYEAKLELHRIVWRKERHNPQRLLASIFGMVVNMSRELERMNARYIKDSVPSATLHGGLSEGNVEFDSPSMSGEGFSEACRCAEDARAARAILVVAANVLQNISPGVLREAGLHSMSVTQSACIPLGETTLARLSQLCTVSA